MTIEERNPLVRWSGYLEDAFKTAFSSDAQKVHDDTRFKDIASVETFIGCPIPVEHKPTVERWFFIIERYKMVISAAMQDNKKDDKPINNFVFMNGAFVRFVESLLILTKSKSSETCIRAAAYIKDFEDLLNTFEEYLYKQIIEDINSTNLQRNTIREQMTI
jgi:hypothetical protein